MYRRDLFAFASLSVLAGLGLAKSPRNISIDFDGPIPPVDRYREHLSQRFSGNFISYNTPAKGPQYDPYDILLRKVALGPALEQGASVYVVQSNTDRLTLDLMMDERRSGAARKYSAESFRPIYLIGEMPMGLFVNRALGVTRIEDVASLARQRSSTARRLNCEVGHDIGSKLARRFARLSSATIDITVNWSGHPHSESMLRKASSVDFFIAPIGPLPLSPRVKERFTLAAALCLQGQPIVSEFDAPPRVDDGLPRLLASSPFASMAIVPSRGFFVSSREDDADVDLLLKTFQAVFKEPEVSKLHQWLVPLTIGSVKDMDAKFAAEMGSYRGLMPEV